MAGFKEKVFCGGYEIYIGYGLLDNIATHVSFLREQTTVYIISDQQVGHLYGERLKNSFLSLQTSCVLITQSHFDTISLVKRQIEEVAGNKFIVSLGSSSTHKFSKILTENCKYCVEICFVPTSLTGCVNFSIDEDELLKEIQGKYSQPKRIYIDTEILRTLPHRHLMNGISEIIKVAIICSSGWRKWTENIANELKEMILTNENDLLDFIESNANLLIANQGDVINVAVIKTLQIKSKIVDVALRKKNPKIVNVLRLGNSIGEAIEAIARELLSGECTSIGMVKEAEVYAGNILSYSTVGRLVRCLKRFELPTRIPHYLNTCDILAKMETFPNNANMNSVAFVLEKQISIVPALKASGALRVPGSKSISNRVLLIAAIGKGKCHISGLLHSDDTQVMINALERIGARFQWIDNDEVLVVHGTGGKFQLTNPEHEIFVNHSGTSARFLTTFFTLVKGETENPILLTGSSRMKERPMGPLVDSLRTQGCKIKYLETVGCLPLGINYTGLKGGLLRLSAKLSSTFVTSVLLSAPYATNPMIVELEEENPTSLAYILMTVQLMAKFNIHVTMEKLNRFIVPCGVYENPSHFEIEVDASSATYPLSIAAVTGGTVSVFGIGKKSLQGDAKFYKLLQNMGCTTFQSDNFTTVTGPSNGVLQSVTVDMASMTDAFMTAIAVGAVAHGRTEITGISNQRVKECNRIAVMVQELQKIGISSGELEDGMWVEGIGDWSLEKRREKLRKTFISCHNDHRIAMSFAVLGCVLENIIITDKECTEKTYPSFWNDCRNKLGLIIQPNSTYYIEDLEKFPINRSFPPCIFIIGMRGCGKTVLGLKASQTFRLKFIDMDIFLEEKWQESIFNFVSKHGWEQFRSEESELLQQLINEKCMGTIVCCGGGVIESEISRMLLKNYRYVIYIESDLHSIISNLNQEINPRRLNLNEPIENTYCRRLPWYEECSGFKFRVASDAKNMKKVHENFAVFLRTMIPSMQSFE